MDNGTFQNKSSGQKPLTSVRIPGRYFRSELKELFRAIYTAGATGKKPTESERKIGYIDYSISHDFREGFRQRPHGFDAMNIASVVKMKFIQMVREEQRQQEARTLHSFAEAARTFLIQVESRLAEIDIEMGSVVLCEREREIENARVRIRERIESKMK